MITVQKLMKRFKTLKVEEPEDDEPENIFDLMDQTEKGDENYIDAVKDISFSLKTNERFILLGVNGAGKSTTFKCLTVEEQISSGSMKIGDHFIEDYYSQPELMRGMVGYCP